MNDDINEKLKSLLSNAELMNTFSNLLNGSKSSSDESKDIQNESNYEIQNAISKINSSDDKRINLLNALKPYMRNSRKSNIDNAIKMLKLTKLSSLFKDL